MKNKLVLLLAFIFILSEINAVFAMNNPDGRTREELSEIQEKRIELKKEFLDKQGKIDELDLQEQETYNEVKQLDEEIALMKEKIRNLEEIISLTNIVVVEMKQDILDLNTRIDRRNEVIKKRLRSLQAQGGGTYYLDLLMGAKSISEFFDFATAVTKIIEADKEILRDHYNDQQLKKQQEKELHSKLAAYDEDLKKMELLSAELNSKISEKNSLLKSLKIEKEQHESELMDMYEVYVNLTSQEIAILAETQASSAHDIANVNMEDVFIMPTTGVLTSGYGPRWGTIHSGIDIANKGSNTKVFAAAEGTVIRSYYSKSYGNCVMITHRINGETYTTVYAHLEKSIVEAGQRVEKGEMLGYMGNTGFSTGQHLHFEIHEGPWNKDRSNSVDPRIYLDISLLEL